MPSNRTVESLVDEGIEQIQHVSTVSGQATGQRGTRTV